MRCIRPLKASINNNGDITYRSKDAIEGLVPFTFDCRKCLPCRLNIAREKAIRATHEARMHKGNIFLTLTYSDEHMESSRLQYRDWQLFIKRLREKQVRGIKDKEARNSKYIPYMVTGEYGDKTKRPHWHAILFNYYPTDAKFKYITQRGEHVFKSEEVEKLWGKGHTEFGSVTIESAGYVARYAAKKLVHGKDEEHDYHPIHKTSCKRAIGRSWIEKYWRHTFENGFITLPNGSQAKIPRYYTDWLRANMPEKYVEYYNGPLARNIEKAEKRQRKEEMEFLASCVNYKGPGHRPLFRREVQERVLQAKFKQLQEANKL
jgi:hypothetical protein